MSEAQERRYPNSVTLESQQTTAVGAGALQDTQLIVGQSPSQVVCHSFFSGAPVEIPANAAGVLLMMTSRDGISLRRKGTGRLSAL